MPNSTNELKLQKLLANEGLLDKEEKVDISVLRGGYTNQVYRLKTDQGKDWVIKQYAEISTNPLYPIFPEAEHLALETFSTYGYSPKPVSLLSDSSCGQLLIYQWVDGDIWQEHVELVGQLLSAVHRVEPDSSFRQLPISIEDISDQVDWLLSMMEEQQKIKSALEPYTTRAIHQANLPRCIIHTDCGPGNIIVGHNGCKLIDLQCPGLGNPVEDLANFSSPAIQHLYGLPPLTGIQRANFLASYENPAVIEHFDWMLPVFSKRMAAYCAFRQEQFKQSNPEISDRYRVALNLELELLEDIYY